MAPPSRRHAPPVREERLRPYHGPRAAHGTRPRDNAAQVNKMCGLNFLLLIFFSVTRLYFDSGFSAMFFIAVFTASSTSGPRQKSVFGVSKARAWCRTTRSGHTGAWARQRLWSVAPAWRRPGRAQRCRARSRLTPHPQPAAPHHERMPGLGRPRAQRARRAVGPQQRRSY